MMERIRSMVSLGICGWRMGKSMSERVGDPGLAYLSAKGDLLDVIIAICNVNQSYSLDKQRTAEHL